MAMTNANQSHASVSSIDRLRKRKLTSWIDAFVNCTGGIEAPPLFRKWAAISTIAGVLEQKVFVTTTSPMYANMYVFLVAPPGGGKSRTIDIAHDMLSTLPDPMIAPTSVNAASIIDQLCECKRCITDSHGPSVEYHSMNVLVGEFGTFMSQYDNSLIALLTDFYNVRPYGQRRRGGNLKITIPLPQLNMLIGTTPANLMRFMPEGAWTQGFTSRIMFVYSDEKEVVDDFAQHRVLMNTDLVNDLKVINSLSGQFVVTEDYRHLVNIWREGDENTPPKPDHPKLHHYNARRKEHLYRLSMISAVDHGNALVLTQEDFMRAMRWMVEVEAHIPEIFAAVTMTADSEAADEAVHMIAAHGGMVQETTLARFLHKRVGTNCVETLIGVMVQGGLIRLDHKDRFGASYYTLCAGPGEPKG